MRRVDPFAEFTGWEDVDEIKRAIEEAFAAGAGVSVETLRAALRRIVYDGYYGPVSDSAWRDVDGTRVTMARAKRIVRDAQAASLPSVRVSHPDAGFTCSGVEDCRHEDHELLGDDGPMFHQEAVEISREALLDWYFGALRAIYGRIDI